MLVRNLDESVKAALKRRAALHGRSLEEEVRQLLWRAAQESVQQPKGQLGSRLAARFAGSGLDQPLPELRGQAARGLTLPVFPHKP